MRKIARFHSVDSFGKLRVLRDRIVVIGPFGVIGGSFGHPLVFGCFGNSRPACQKIVDGFKLVHDTFHHTLAHGEALFPDHTGIVHVSGVTDQTVTVAQMQDQHRVLVDRADRLGNIDQLAALAALGWTGPVSFEAFSPLVHASITPSADLSASIAFIRDGLARKAA